MPLQSFGSNPSGGRYIHISTRGDNGGTGAKDSPFATLQKAINIAGAGDTILVASGRYMGAGDKGYAARISHKSGTADAPITIKGQGGPVILDNSDDTSTGAVHSLRVQNSKHWVIEGVGFTGAAQNSKASLVDRRVGRAFEQYHPEGLRVLRQRRPGGADLRAQP